MRNLPLFPPLLLSPPPPHRKKHRKNDMKLRSSDSGLDFDKKIKGIRSY